jgi:hypothetical protein
MRTAQELCLMGNIRQCERRDREDMFRLEMQQSATGDQDLDVRACQEELFDLEGRWHYLFEVVQQQ